MENDVYKTLTITGSSANSIEEAIQRAVKRTGQSVHALSWFEVAEIRGNLKEDQIQAYQVTVKVGFKVD